MRQAFLSVFIIAAALVAGCGDEQPQQEASTTSGTDREVTVFAAASMRESLADVAAAFHKATGLSVVHNFAGSNDLAHQLVAAPKGDVFISAAENWMDTVEQARRIMEGTRRSFLSNSLVIVASNASSLTVKDPCLLATMEFRNLALGDQEAVPAGKYAKKWLGDLVCDGDTLWGRVSDRVAPTPDVRAALGLVLADPEVIGIVYRTDQMAFADRTRILYEAVDGPPIRYVVAGIVGGPESDAAQKYLEFLQTEQAMEIFRSHGFTAPTTTR